MVVVASSSGNDCDTMYEDEDQIANMTEEGTKEEEETNPGNWNLTKKKETSQKDVRRRKTTRTRSTTLTATGPGSCFTPWRRFLSFQEVKPAWKHRR